jgi:two-component system, NarL family, sensor histidine kinase DevS
MHDLALVGGASPSTPERALDEAEKIRRRLVRLALDVHDGPMQNVAAVGIRLRELEQTLDGELREELGELLTELGNAEAGLRRLLTMLGSDRPAIETIEEIVRESIDRFRSRSRAEVTVEGDLLFQPDTESQMITIEALIRESLANVAKHARAKHVQIRIGQSPAGFLLEIEDDGRGFDPATARENAMGIAGMRERIRMLGGEFELVSRPGGPTVVTALLRRWRRDASTAEQRVRGPAGSPAAPALVST